MASVLSSSSLYESGTSTGAAKFSRKCSEDGTGVVLSLIYW